MTEEHARTTANIVMTAAALGAAVFVLRSPGLRRMAWQVARRYVSGPLAASTALLVRDAWEASGRSGADRAAAAGASGRRVSTRHAADAAAV